VLDTYFVFLRTRVLMGLLTLAQEQELVERTKAWLEENVGESAAYGMYLENWGEWRNPWEKGEE
jgi:hypothetical protein